MAIDGYSKDDLISFLDFLKVKGLMKPATVSARKGAAGKVLDILDDSEALDLRNIDFEEVMERFMNLSSGKYSPQSLRTYKSRTLGALEDFLRYKKNPASFKVDISTRSARKRVVERELLPVPTSAHVPSDEILSREEHQAIPQIKTLDFPISLRRASCIVQVNGIPVDLSSLEAKKISNIITAMVEETE